MVSPEKLKKGKICSSLYLLCALSLARRPPCTPAFAKRKAVAESTRPGSSWGTTLSPWHTPPPVHSAWHRLAHCRCPIVCGCSMMLQGHSLLSCKVTGLGNSRMFVPARPLQHNLCRSHMRKLRPREGNGFVQAHIVRAQMS